MRVDRQQGHLDLWAGSVVSEAEESESIDLGEFESKPLESLVNHFIFDLFFSFIASE